MTHTSWIKNLSLKIFLFVYLEVATEFSMIKNEKMLIITNSQKLAYHGYSGSREEVIRIFLPMKQPDCF